MLKKVKNFIYNIPKIKKIITRKENYYLENLELKKELENIRKINETYVNFDWAKEMLIKKESFENIKNKTNTLVLGSSHGDYGFNPLFLENSFNMSLPSQDLYYSYHLYKKNNTKKIKNIILFYSVFSPGFSLIKTSEKQRALLYKIIFKIPYQTKDNTMELENKKYNDYLRKIKKYLIINKKYLGYENHSHFIKMNESIEKRAKTHYRENIRNNDQLIYIKKIYELANKNNQNVFIIIPPAQKTYRSYIPRSNILFKSLLKLTNKLKIKIVNFYEDDRFSNKYFWDSDHLNNQGAIFLTKLIKNNL